MAEIRRSARAHLTGEDDIVVTVKPVLDRVGDFAAILAESFDEAAAYAPPRRAETIGRPLGNKASDDCGAPVTVTTKVMAVFDGASSYTGGILAGDTSTMGRSAWIRIGRVDAVIASLPTYEYHDEQFRAAGFDPNERKFIVVKNPMNHQQGYPAAVASFILDTPGPTTPDLRQLDLPRAGRPFFPFDSDFVPPFDVLSNNQG